MPWNQGRARRTQSPQFAEAPKKKLKYINHYPMCKMKLSCDKETAYLLTSAFVVHEVCPKSIQPTYESHMGHGVRMSHTWVKHCYIWVLDKSRDGLQMDRIWVSDESQMDHMGHGLR